jgi:hypothetical protein
VNGGAIVGMARRRPWIVRLWRRISGREKAEKKCRDLAMRVRWLRAESRCGGR